MGASKKTGPIYLAFAEIDGTAQMVKCLGGATTSGRWSLPLVAPSASSTAQELLALSSEAAAGGMARTWSKEYSLCSAQPASPHTWLVATSGASSHCSKHEGQSVTQVELAHNGRASDSGGQGHVQARYG